MCIRDRFCPLYTRGPFYFPQKIQKNFPLPATILTHPSFITIEASEILPCKASEKTHKFPCECREFLGVFLSCFRRVSRRIMLYHRIRGKAFALRCSKGVFYAQLVCASPHLLYGAVRTVSYTHLTHLISTLLSFSKPAWYRLSITLR